jgi:hypothetical protein
MAMRELKTEGKEKSVIQEESILGCENNMQRN